MTYPNLVALHHNGIGVPKRPILSVVAELKNPPQTSTHLNKLVKTWFKNVESHNAATLLDQIGKYYKNRVYETFGSSYLSPTDRNPDPLIDTGELRSQTSYKTSKDNKVKK